MLSLEEINQALGTEGRRLTDVGGRRRFSGGKEVPFESAVPDPTPESVQRWVVHVSDVAPSDNLLGFLEAVLERTEQRWFAEKYGLAGGAADNQASLNTYCPPPHLAESATSTTTQWATQQATQAMWERAADARHDGWGKLPDGINQANLPVHLWKSARAFAEDIFERHPTLGNTAVSRLVAEFVPQPTVRQVSMWRHRWRRKGNA